MHKFDQVGLVMSHVTHVNGRCFQVVQVTVGIKGGAGRQLHTPSSVSQMRSQCVAVSRLMSFRKIPLLLNK
jgi:hypothetical protein